MVTGSVVTILGISVNTDPVTTRFEDKRDDDQTERECQVTDPPLTSTFSESPVPGNTQPIHHDGDNYPN